MLSANASSQVPLARAVPNSDLVATDALDVGRGHCRE
jgi:hypothetical protein